MQQWDMFLIYVAASMLLLIDVTYYSNKSNTIQLSVENNIEEKTHMLITTNYIQCIALLKYRIVEQSRIYRFRCLITN